MRLPDGVTKMWNKSSWIGGTNPNNTDEDGQTPLHKAVRCGKKDVVQELLDRGAQLNKGQTNKSQG